VPTAPAGSHGSQNCRGHARGDRAGRSTTPPPAPTATRADRHAGLDRHARGYAAGRGSGCQRAADRAHPRRAADPLPSGTGVIHGSAFVDADANGVANDGEVGLSNVQVTLNPTNGAGLARWTLTGDDATFSFDARARHLPRRPALPDNYVATTMPARTSTSSTAPVQPRWPSVY